MNGFRYWRRKRRMTLQELAQAVGCTVPLLVAQEQKASLSVSSATVAAVAKTLDVTMEELFQTYPEEALEAGDHHSNRSRGGRKMPNALGCYRLARNLTYQELADQLGAASRQAAQALCVSPRPSPRFLAQLAALENMTMEEFLHRYST